MATDRSNLEEAPSDTALLEVASVTAGYGGAVTIRDVSLQVRPGQMVGLLGANGAGKTTTLRTVFGPIRPLGGRVRLFGEDVTGRSSRHMVKRGCVLVPEGRGLISELTVLQNLELGGYYRKRSEIPGLIAQVLDLFPLLGARIRQPAGILSGGEQQMLAIARGLMAEPRVLLIDELSLGLAPKVVESLYAQLKTLVSGGKRAVLVVEQHATMALKYCDYLFVLQGQTVASQGPPTAFADGRALADLYLRG